MESKIVNGKKVSDEDFKKLQEDCNILLIQNESDGNYKTLPRLDG